MENKNAILKIVPIGTSFKLVTGYNQLVLGYIVKYCTLFLNFSDLIYLKTLNEKDP